MGESPRSFLGHAGGIVAPQQWTGQCTRLVRDGTMDGEPVTFGYNWPGTKGGMFGRMGKDGMGWPNRRDTEMDMKKTIDAVAQSVTFTFDGLEPVVLRMDAVSAQCRDHAMLHGFSARIGDNAAIQKSAENGFRVTEAMRRDAVVEMVEHYASGTSDWNLKASARKPVQHPVFLAIAAKLGISYEAAVAKIQADNLAELSA